MATINALNNQSAPFTVFAGDLAVSAGNLTLPATSSTQGQIKFSSAVLHTQNALNIFFGLNSGNFTTTGQRNYGIGAGTFTALTSGSDNVAFGSNALNAVTSTGSNTAIGTNSLSQIVTGQGNIGIHGGISLTLADSNNVMIAANGTAGDSGRIRIGTNGTQTSCFITGIDTVNVGSVAKVVTLASDQLGTAIITSGTNVTVTPGANTITIAALGGGAVAWSVITANQTAAVNNGYFCNKAGTLTLALPAVSAIGDVIEVVNINTALGIQFTQAANQQIFFSTANTTIGATGTLTSSAVGDTIKLVCRTANLVWWATSSIGNWTPA